MASPQKSHFGIIGFLQVCCKILLRNKSFQVGSHFEAVWIVIDKLRQPRISEMWHDSLMHIICMNDMRFGLNKPVEAQ